MRITKKVFVDLAIRMIGFGIIIGVIFPFLMLLLGVPSHLAMSVWFFLICIGAGIIVGLVNIALSRITVAKKLKMVTEKMNHVKEMIIDISVSGNVENCNTESCQIQDDSDDEFGKNAKSFNELVESFSKSLKMQDTIREYTEILSSQLELNPLASKALEILINYAAASAGAILYEKNGGIELLSSYGINDADTLKSNQLIADALNKGEQYSVSLPDNLVIESILTKFKPMEVIIEPVKYMNIPIAVIVLASTESFKTELKKQIVIFSKGLSIALNNAFEHEQLQKLAALDPLTGIYNKRFGLIRFHEEYSSSIRIERPLGVLMFDIDHFKKINDTYGHLIGDRVLINITQQIRNVMRVGDLFIRFGGEEFLLILPGASKNDSYIIAERIRHIVKESKITYGSNNISVTISIGCDSLPETSVSGEEDLIKNADEALYRAKNSGRDQVVIY